MRIVVFGEAMFEYRAPSAASALAFGGDTLNTAIHLSRLGIDVAYVTAVGTDPLSDALCAAWAAEGLDTRWVLRHPQRQPGIYAIHNDDAGERSFLYWRSHSAVREFYALEGSAAVSAAMAETDLLYYSLISLAVLPAAGRDALLAATAAQRGRGGRFAFDSNYRPALWEDRAIATEVADRAMALTDIGLPTWSDETALRDHIQPAAAVAQSWRQAGATEVAVKIGPAGCALATDGHVVEVPTPAVLPVLDSSGAGDAFNAGYLAARLRGAAPVDAAMAGHQLAGWVIGELGAIPKPNADAPYSRMR